MGRTVNGATSLDTPQRRNSIVKHVFRHDKSSFAVFRRRMTSFAVFRRLLGVYTDRHRAAHSIPHFTYRIPHAAIPHFTHSRFAI